MKAEKILAIPLSEPERLFRDRHEIRSEYRALQKFWHPDVCPDPRADKVFAHIGQLFEAALEKARGGIWQVFSDAVDLIGTDGRKRVVRFRRRRSFELGEVLISRRMITYLIERHHEDLVHSALRRIGNLRYPDAKFRDNLEPYLPKVEKLFETSTHVCVIMRKDVDDVLVDDLRAHLGGMIEPVHVAWMVSAMMSLLSYLEINDVTVNGLEPAAVLVNPRQHSAAFRGGWWYAAEVGSPVMVLPPWTHGQASGFFRSKKVGDPRLDLDCAKAIARYALGDLSGGSLRARGDLPEPMRNFLMAPSGRSAVKEYRAWEKARDASFGPRRFHELLVTGDDVYPKET